MVPFLPSGRGNWKGKDPVHVKITALQSHCIIFSSGMLEKTIRGNLLHGERAQHHTFFRRQNSTHFPPRFIMHYLMSLISFALWSSKRMHCNKEVSVAFLLPNFLSRCKCANIRPEFPGSLSFCGGGLTVTWQLITIHLDKWELMLTAALNFVSCQTQFRTG